jgi:peptide/nickel transport system ATP-binding protein
VAGVGKAHLREEEDILLRVEDLVVEFPVGRTGLVVNAVSGISLDVRRGETLGLVGESGCGKSTTGRAIMQLPPPTGGTVHFDGKDLTQMSRDDMRAARTKMQMIFQDPISSLNPRRKVRDIVMEPLNIWKRGTTDERGSLVDRTLEEVGIDPTRAGESQAHQFSGGQCQRISIARSLVLDPSLIICDEPVSALDVSVQAQVINLLEDLKARHGLTLIFIAHDLAVVKNISDRVAVMYLGKLCEVAPSDDLYARPGHPYTNVLLASIPVPDPNQTKTKVEVTGEPPSPVLPPSGCRFHPRCPNAQDDCVTTEPELREWAPGHFLACHHPVENSVVAVHVETPTDAVPDPTPTDTAPTDTMSTESRF